MKNLRASGVDLEQIVDFDPLSIPKLNIKSVRRSTAQYNNLDEMSYYARSSLPCWTTFSFHSRWYETMQLV